MGYVPDRVRPDLPPAVEDAVIAFGHPARAAILGHLRVHGATTRGELAANLALIPKTIQYHVGVLAALGLLAADPPAARSGQRTRYSLIEPRLAQLHSALTRHLGLDDEPARAQHKR